MFRHPGTITGCWFIGSKELLSLKNVLVFIINFRDTTVYAISTEKHGLPEIMKLLGDIILRPNITEEELQHARQTALYEMEDMEMRPEQEAIILEMMHCAAWNNNTLGHPRYCPQENADKITREEILRFMKTNYQPDRMVVSGVGVEHAELVDLTNEYFNFSQTTWENEGIQSSPVNQEVAQYTGGDMRVSKLHEHKITYR